MFCCSLKHSTIKKYFIILRRIFNVCVCLSHILYILLLYFFFLGESYIEVDFYIIFWAPAGKSEIFVFVVFVFVVKKVKRRRVNYEQTLFPRALQCH